MEKILNELLVNAGFNNKNKLESEKLELCFEEDKVSAYKNNNDETYILFFVKKLGNELLNQILKFLEKQVYNNEIFSRAEKANLAIILIYKTEKLKDEEKNYIFQIEENALFYQKFFLWYTQEEYDALIKYINKEKVSQYFYENIINKENFEEFKESINNENKEDNVKAYELLSRIYIKLPFMTLNNIDTLSKSLFEYVKQNLDNLAEGLFNMIENNNEDNIDNIINMVEITERENKSIEKEISKVGGTIEK